MSDNLGFALAIVFAFMVPAAMTSYAAYWAFSIRRSLVGRVYRNHALWLGTLCALVVAQNLSNNSINSILNIVNEIGIFIIFPVLFAFIDTSVRVARRSDPLLRSVLRWEKLRVVVWADLVALEVLLIASVANQPFAYSDLGNLLWYILVLPPFIVGGSALLIGAKRSGDSVLRGSLKWLGVVLVLVFVNMLVSLVVSNIPDVSQFDSAYSYPALPGAAIGIVSAYAFYRSAHSLAPINRLQAIEPATISTS
jgi:hypothetical protein